MTTSGPANRWGNLWDAFRSALVRGVDDPALSLAGETWTYARLGEAVGVVAGELADRGVGAGDRVVVLTANGFGFPVTDLALMSLGAVKTPLNLMQSAAEVARATEFVEPVAIVLDAAGSELAGLVPSGLARLLVDDELLRRRGAPLPPAHGLDSSAPAALYLSSGTTGRPKGIVHSQESVLANMWAHLLQSGIAPGERLLLTTPLAHSAGLFTEAALLCGAHVRIEPGFDAQRWIDLVEEHAITWSYGVPTMVRRIVDLYREQGRRPTTLRTYQYGSAPMSPGLLAQALEVFGPVLQQLYAQTECPQYATLLTKADHERAVSRPELLASAGRDTVMCRVSIRGEDGTELPAGEVGEVCLRGPYVMDDYWRDREGYLARFHGDWLRTGDVGRLDESGYLYLVDRLADMIVSGGMNVYSVEVEAALSRHPGVAHAVVVGVPDDEWGEGVTAVVVPHAGIDHEDLREQLAAHCRAELAAYKRPKRYDFREAIPLTPYGKPDKKSIRQAYWGDAARKVN